VLAARLRDGSDVRGEFIKAAYSAGFGVEKPWLPASVVSTKLGGTVPVVPLSGSAAGGFVSIRAFVSDESASDAELLPMISESPSSRTTRQTDAGRCLARYVRPLWCGECCVMGWGSAGYHERLITRT
jgi:hypothetical protein